MNRKNLIIASSILGLLIIASVITVLAINYISNNTSSQQAETNGPLTLYYIAVDDNGKNGTKIGCGDSVMAVKTKSVSTKDSVKSTFDTLLSDHSATYGQDHLYNVLHYSSLSYIGSTISEDTVRVELSGDLVATGICDGPRIQAVLESSAKTAAGVGKAEIVINDKTLSELLSLK